MPIFEIEQYEISATTYRVEAASGAEAIAKLLDGDGDIVNGSHDYIEVAEHCGLSAEDHPQLAEELRSLDVPVGEVISSIRSVRRID